MNKQLSGNDKLTLNKLKASGPNASISYNGHPFDEIISAIQKYVRRCNLDMSLYAAVEADLFSLVKKDAGISYSNAKSRRTNFINRLRVIMCEEIGIAEPLLLLEFDNAYLEYLNFRESDTDIGIAKSRNAFIKIIYMLVNSKKIRLVSDIKTVYFTDNSTFVTYLKECAESVYDGLEDTIDPDVLGKYIVKDASIDVQKAIDGILSGIKNNNDSAFYWLNKLLKINKDYVRLLFKLLTDWANKGSQLWDSSADHAVIPDKKVKMLSIMETLYRYYYGTSKDIGFIGKKDETIFIILPLLYAVRKIDFNNDITFKADLTDEEVFNIYQKNLKFSKVLDSFCIDMHTKNGKKNGCNHLTFAQEGALVCNQADNLLNVNYRKIYVFNKMLQAGIDPNNALQMLNQIKLSADDSNIKISETTKTADVTNKDVNTKAVNTNAVISDKIIKVRLPLPMMKMNIKINNNIVTNNATINTATNSDNVKDNVPKIIPKVLPKIKLPLNFTIKKTNIANSNNSNNSSDTSNSNNSNDNNYDSETKCFMNVIRAQLTCSNNRPDVYFANFYSRSNKIADFAKNEQNALSYDNERVVVKGPFIPDNDCMNDALKSAIKLNSFKKLLSLNFIDMKVMFLYADFWREDKAVPLGTRLKTNVNQKYHFLVMKDIVHNCNSVIKTKMYGSKLWPLDTIVYDGSDNKDFGIMNINKLDNDNLSMQTLLAYAFRYVFEIVDTCDRNFIINWKDKLVYSIDEENWAQGRRKYFVGNKPLAKKDNQHECFVKMLAKHSHNLKEILSTWKTIINDSKNKEVFNVNNSIIMNNIDYLISSDISKLLF